MARKKTKAKIKTSANRRRKGKLAVIMPWLKRFGLRLGVLSLMLWVGAWLHLSGSFTRAMQWSKNGIIEQSADMGFVIADISLEGREYSDVKFMRALLNTEKGDPIFAFDPKEARTMLERMEWVESAYVERRLPDQVYVRLIERVPMALWQRDGALHLIDDKGEQIKTDRLSRFADLVTVMGEGAPANTRALLLDLQGEDEVFSRVKAASRIGNRRWDLRLKSGVIVKLPEENTPLALRRLVDAQNSDQLLDKSLETIDLRVPDKITVKAKLGGVQNYKASIKAVKGRDT